MVRRAGVAKRSLFGTLFNSESKSPAPSPFEDSRRFLLSYLRDLPGNSSKTIAQGIAACTTTDQLRTLLAENAGAFAAMTDTSKAQAFVARALDLLE
jgi:hypothetical protein